MLVKLGQTNRFQFVPKAIGTGNMAMAVLILKIEKNQQAI